MKFYLKKVGPLLCGAICIICAACAPSSVPPPPVEASNDDVLKIFDQIPRSIQIYNNASGFRLSVSYDMPYEYLYETLYTELHRQLKEENIPAQPQANVDWLYRIEVSSRPNLPLYSVDVSDSLISLNGVQYRQNTLTDTLLSCIAVSEITSLLVTDPSGIAVRFSEDMTSDRLFYPLVNGLAQSQGKAASLGAKPDAYYDLEIVTGAHTRTTCRVTPDALLTSSGQVANSTAYAAADELFRQHIVYPNV